MTEREWIKSLDGNESAPQLDVTDDVLRSVRLQSREAEAPSLAWPALFATIAGSTVALIAFQIVATLQDPFSNFLDAFKLVLQ